MSLNSLAGFHCNNLTTASVALAFCIWVSVHSLVLLSPAHSIGAPCCQHRRWSECTEYKSRRLPVIWYLSHLLNVVQLTQQLSRPLDAISELCKAKCANHRLNFDTRHLFSLHHGLYG